MIRLWSRRFTVAKGWHWEAERSCSDDTAEAWLKVFQDDEPDSLFILARNEPMDLAS